MWTKWHRGGHAWTVHRSVPTQTTLLSLVVYEFFTVPQNWPHSVWGQPWVLMIYRADYARLLTVIPLVQRLGCDPMSTRLTSLLLMASKFTKEKHTNEIPVIHGLVLEVKLHWGYMCFGADSESTGSPAYLILEKKWFSIQRLEGNRGKKNIWQRVNKLRLLRLHILSTIVVIEPSREVLKNNWRLLFISKLWMPQRSWDLWLG